MSLRLLLHLKIETRLSWLSHDIMIRPLSRKIMWLYRCAVKGHCFYIMRVMGYCKARVVRVPTLSSLTASRVVVMTTYGGISDNKVGIMTTLGFQRMNPRHHHWVHKLTLNHYACRINHTEDFKNNKQRQTVIFGKKFIISKVFTRNMFRHESSRVVRKSRIIQDDWLRQCHTCMVMACHCHQQAWYRQHDDVIK